MSRARTSPIPGTSSHASGSGRPSASRARATARARTVSGTYRFARPRAFSRARKASTHQTHGGAERFMLPTTAAVLGGFQADRARGAPGIGPRRVADLALELVPEALGLDLVQLLGDGHGDQAQRARHLGPGLERHHRAAPVDAGRDRRIVRQPADAARRHAEEALAHARDATRDLLGLLRARGAVDEQER